MSITLDEGLSSPIRDLLAVGTPEELEAIARLLLGGQIGDPSQVARAGALPVSAATAAALTRLIRAAAKAQSPSVGEAAGLALATSIQARHDALVSMPVIDIVWTGPLVQGSPARTTNQALFELITEARTYLLVVEYAVWTYEGAAREIRERLVAAQRAGVRVVLIAHADTTNRAALREWPIEFRPRFLTWRVPSSHAGVKVHAKVAVADDRVALVTSANLTHLGLRENMEFGVLIKGAPAATIRRHFEWLEREGVLQPWSI